MTASPYRPILAAGLFAALAMAVVGPLFGLYRYADGSIFTYGVAAGEGWAFHFRNIAHRAVIYVIAQVPGEAVGHLTGSLRAATLTYGVVFFSLPLISLGLTFALDRTEGKIVTVGASVSTVAVLPLVFGFPTEMWASHAIVWPLYALVARPLSPVPVLIGQTLLSLTHEAGVIFGGVIVLVGVLFLPTARRVVVLAATYLVAIGLWYAVRKMVVPDPYLAEVLTRNAWNLFEFYRLLIPITALGLVALIGVPVLAILSRSGLGARAPFLTAGGLAALMAVWWLGFDTSLHAETRYSMRAAILGLVPIMLFATALILRANETGRGGSLATPFARHVVLATLALIALIHAVEAGKFAKTWVGYERAVKALALSEAADPALGDPAFISTDRLDRATDIVSWNSTTPYLSVLLSAEAGQKRLVVDPRTGYFWLPCALAERHAAASSTVPEFGRSMIARYSCQHRPTR